ncbi:sulfotransferase domain-containing protein [Asticcacaulis solisilvae]|uniref:sulfotransferase domain-containing protein n=1 Tax=Asticcacaulis solisilvae TaxID=1217274 RepID=UPI003FD74D5F
MPVDHDSNLPRGLVLASYPRSGSNWIRAIMGHAFFGGDEGFLSIRNLGDTTPGETVEFRGRPCPVYKTHGRTEEISQSIDAAAVITVHRHPLDVLLSALNFLNARGQAAFFRDGICMSVNDILAAGDIDYYIDKFCAEDGISQFSRGCGTYSGYHRDLKQFCETRTAFEIVYEDMFAAPDGKILDLYRFVTGGGDCDAGLIRRGAEAQSSQFLSLQKTAYTHRTLLSAQQIARFRAGYRDTLEAMGYCDDREITA